jgi:DNA (cytosine-5)-methyltransferase 1
MALACPTLIQIGYGERAGQSPRVPGLDKPLGTIVSGGGKHALVAAFLNKHYTGVVGQSVEKPIGTVTSWDHHSLGAAHIVKLKGTCKDGQPVTDPLATVQAGGTHYALVASFMAKYYGCDIHGQPVNEPLHTIPTHERFGLVTVVINGETYAIVDIMMRMLTPRELARAQGFRDDYVIDEGTDGRKLSKRVQVRLIGNSVSPPPMQAIIRANVIPHWPKPAPRCKVRREAVTV